MIQFPLRDPQVLQVYKSVIHKHYSLHQITSQFMEFHLLEYVSITAKRIVITPKETFSKCNF